VWEEVRADSRANKDRIGMTRHLYVKGGEFKISPVRSATRLLGLGVGEDPGQPPGLYVGVGGFEGVAEVPGRLSG
jgi:hypothetical protein